MKNSIETCYRLKDNAETALGTKWVHQKEYRKEYKQNRIKMIRKTMRNIDVYQNYCTMKRV